MLKSNVLSILENNAGSLISGGELAKNCGVSRNAVWKAVISLQNEGYQIEILKNSGYIFISDSDILSKEIIMNKLSTNTIGNSVEVLQTVDSTNLYMKRLNINEISEGFVVVSEEQTGGRGRRERVFYSPCGQGIYMSLLLKPEIAAENVQLLTICSAVAVCRAIKNICGIDVGIKWVNDIFYSGKKLCGILTEAVVSAEIRGVLYAVIGIGVNLGNIDEELSDIATSVYQITGKRTYKNSLIAEILNQFEEIYFGFTKNNLKREILDEYIEKLFILNNKILVDDFHDTYTAEVMGVSDDGALIVRNEQGDVLNLQSGEVTLLIDGRN